LRLAALIFYIASYQLVLLYWVTDRVGVLKHKLASSLAAQLWVRTMKERRTGREVCGGRGDEVDRREVGEGNEGKRGGGRRVQSDNRLECSSFSSD
jgi:hypothetical protein